MDLKGAFNMCAATIDSRSVTSLLNIVGQRQFMAMSDGGNAGLYNECLLADPKFMKGLADRGVRHIFLEIDARRSGDLDHFYRGEIDAKTLKNRIGIANALNAEEGSATDLLEPTFFENAKSNGVRIHFVDPKPEVETKYPDKAALYTDISAKVMRGEITNDTEAEDYVKSKGFSIQEMTEYQKILGQQRELANTSISQAIRSKSGNEGALIVYGSLHLGDNANSIPTLIGKDKITVVSMKTPDGGDVEGADYILNAATGEIDRTFKGWFNGMCPATIEQGTSFVTPLIGQ